MSIGPAAGVAAAVDLERRFAAVARLYGAAALRRFCAARVCVIGLGGVGSWAVEALARSGIGYLRLIDLDIVVESNVNRQLQALSAEIGHAKVAVSAQRIAGINPYCRVDAVEEHVVADNVAGLLAEGIDWVIDCADDFRAKAAIIAHCRERHLSILTVGAAGGVSDPLRIRLADLTAAVQDRLLARTRKQLRQRHAFSRDPHQRFGVPCVYSTEAPRYATADGGVSGVRPAGTGGLSCSAGLGSAMPVTASFGLIAVAHVLAQLARQA
ncbi:MAG: tRNA threonylcarbamoyladenosine dehydratase [Gammaproteobacteria bacterium]|nr:tRNA threonylcarbamoyladenosine dehydratase [Gammaproteobacteria bacterium]